MGAPPHVSRSPLWAPLDPQNGISASAQARPLLPQKWVNGGPWPGLLLGVLVEPVGAGGREERQWEGGEVKLGKCLFWNQTIKLVPESL